MTEREDVLAEELVEKPKRSSHVETALRHLEKDKSRLVSKRDELNRQVEAIERAIEALK